MPIHEDYYKSIISRGAFNTSYIQYKSKGDKGKNLSITEYLNMIRPYLSDIINYHKTHGSVRYHSGNKTWVQETPSKWKIQLTMAISIMSSNGSEETRTMHTKSNNMEIRMGSETDKIAEDLIVEDLFESFLQKYQEELEESTRGSKSAYDRVDALYYNLSKVSLNRADHIQIHPNG